MNDATQNPPRLRIDIHYGNVENLPAYHRGPRGDAEALHRAVKAAGYEGIQGGDAELCRKVGLESTGHARVNHPREVGPAAARLQAEGNQCATLHAGWGMESDREIDALAEEVLRVSAGNRFPLYLETHRATLTQDLWRTVELAGRHPGIRFNGDFSHWYTGLELVYGDIESKFVFLQPVFERVRFLHGRIGDPGCIQVGIGDGRAATAVAHFRRMWTLCFLGFLRSAGPGDYICFTPELLGPGIHYARTIRNAFAEEVEACDRWVEARELANLAKACFAEAESLFGRGEAA